MQTVFQGWRLIQGFICLVTLLHNAGIASADNPIVQTEYTADPAPLVYDDRVYLFAGHDEDGSTYYTMNDWLLYSSNDMANWQHHGSPLNVHTFNWADESAWAAQAIHHNGKFYFYAPVHRRGGGMAIGVAVADDVLGPYKDAIGEPLLENGRIDPTVFIDDNGDAYMYWGNPGLFYVKLNEDMISYSGEITQVELTVEGFGDRPDPSEIPVAFDEAPWLYKRKDLYYMIYAAACYPEDIRYSTAPTATGPWTYRGLIMASEGGSFTNHPGVVNFRGKAYFFYHNGALSGGGSFTRSVAVEGFEYESDGAIPQFRMTDEGPQQVQSLDPYVRQEAETMAWGEGVEVEACSEGGMNVAYVSNGDFIKVNGVDFADGPTSFTARVASASGGGNIELRLGSKTGKLIGTCNLSNTGGWQTWANVDCSIDDKPQGVETLFFVFVGYEHGYLFNFDWWRFSK